ncbi:methionine aminopeptidase [Gonapodya prolifera JEL478]|uniref:Methionine aminopeptidase n=1 Tax=Gonapodya prolifera (strain JEL478) TaxID=1344416 RepID=A0A138ZYM8_GONPJ|nr:methionine aminopeptidase [Gonapodya prolifera JEL478]|eukprot:KXS09581.1 methionine aminopeptidase [Gonapodya prolifera JEL478]
MKCPTCIKLKLVDSYFCTQQCFKDHWGSHKEKHVVVFDPFANRPDFKYTGKLTARYPLSPRRKVPDHIPRPDWSETGVPAAELALRETRVIEVLKPDDIKKMREVCRLGREVLDIGAAAVRAGVTTDEIDRIVHEATIERDAYPSPLNYNGFPKSCCTSVNEVICHGIPDRYELQDGDIVNIDVSLYKDGFHADLNETYLVGNVDERGSLLVQTTRECLQKAIELVKPNTPYRSIGRAIERHATSRGFGVIRTYCGHGVHRHFHCAPSVPHYEKNKAVGTMQEGHIFTIEPMISEGKWDDRLWPDRWTAATVDGKRSAQFEHTLLVTKSGCDVLTASPKEDWSHRR